MYLEVQVDRKKFIKTNKIIFKNKEIISMSIKNNEGYVYKGIDNQEDSFYFGKVNKRSEYRLLSKLELTDSNIEEMYEDYLVTYKKFIEEWKYIQIIHNGGV